MMRVTYKQLVITSVFAGAFFVWMSLRFSTKPVLNPNIPRSASRHQTSHVDVKYQVRKAAYGLT